MHARQYGSVAVGTQLHLTTFGGNRCRRKSLTSLAVNCVFACPLTIACVTCVHRHQSTFHSMLTAQLSADCMKGHANARNISFIDTSMRTGPQSFIVLPLLLKILAFTCWTSHGDSHSIFKIKADAKLIGRYLKIWCDYSSVPSSLFHQTKFKTQIFLLEM